MEDKVYSLCGGSSYDPASEKCQNGAVVALSGPSTPNTPYVEPPVEKPICSATITQNCVKICFEKQYNPTTHFCTRSKSNPQVVPLCGDKGLAFPACRAAIAAMAALLAKNRGTLFIRGKQTTP